MRSFLRNIRSKPKAIRNQYALGISAFFTSVVALVWILTGMNLDTKTQDTIQTNDTIPFSSLTKQIKEQWATVRGSLGNGATTTEPVVVEDPRTLTITPENKAELTGTSTEWNASTTGAIEPEYVVVQIATSSRVATNTATATVSTESN